MTTILLNVILSSDSCSEESIFVMRLKLRDISYIAAAVAILAASAWVSIPSSPPFTLQILAVCIIGGLFGAKKAVLSVLLYIAVGLVGMPVFSGFRGGAAALAGETGGYVVGFAFTALITGLFSGKGGRHLALGMLLGLIACYVFGTVWYVALTNAKSAAAVGVALLRCVVPYIVPDVLKLSVAYLAIPRLRKAGISLS